MDGKQTNAELRRAAIGREVGSEAAQSMAQTPSVRQDGTQPTHTFEQRSSLIGSEIVTGNLNRGVQDAKTTQGPETAKEGKSIQNPNSRHVAIIAADTHSKERSEDVNDEEKTFRTASIPLHQVPHSPAAQPDDDDLAEHIPEDQIAPIHNNNEHFSDYEDDSSTFYKSLLSSATDYYWENGRRYHANRYGQYMLPNDDIELDREDMKHHSYLLMTDFRLHLSPIGSNPQLILDIGTGTGIWAIQMAETYPSASILGTDISPVQPKWVPPNVTFEVDDLEQEWLFRPGTYDLINIRFMFLAVKDWPAALSQAYRTLKPGGYLELSEMEFRPTTIPPVSSGNPDVPQPLKLWEFMALFANVIKESGFEMQIAEHFKKMMENAGFVDIVETRFEYPWGPWPQNRKWKNIGLWNSEQLKQGLPGILLGFFTRSLGWPKEKVESFEADVRKQLDDRSFKVMDHIVVVYGRKPLDASKH